ncbi:MAG: transposase [Planctomycetota bacterium]
MLLTLNFGGYTYEKAVQWAGQGKAVPEVCKEIEISQQTYYRWRQKYGGMSPDMIKQLRAVQKENAQLRKLVADQALDISILKVAAEGNF